MYCSQTYPIISNNEIAKNIYEATVQTNDTKWIKPGNFINIKLHGHFLRRPMAISDFNAKSFSFIYEVVGEGTHTLSNLKENDSIEIITRVGNSFDYQKQYGKPLLICGGAGIGPILCLAKFLKEHNIPFEYIVGFANKEKVIKIDIIKKLCPNAHICTDDGSYGEKGSVVDIMKKHNLTNLYYYACGSHAMLKAIHHITKKGQLSLDERMGCGFGACMGCAIETKQGTQRICVNGPIFLGEDLLW